MPTRRRRGTGGELLGARSHSAWRVGTHGLVVESETLHQFAPEAAPNRTRDTDVILRGVTTPSPYPKPQPYRVKRRDSPMKSLSRLTLGLHGPGGDE